MVSLPVACWRSDWPRKKHVPFHVAPHGEVVGPYRILCFAVAERAESDFP